MKKIRFGKLNHLSSQNKNQSKISLVVVSESGR